MQPTRFEPISNIRIQKHACFCYLTELSRRGASGEQDYSDISLDQTDCRHFRFSIMQIISSVPIIRHMTTL
jgi:hypothetical protein